MEDAARLFAQEKHKGQVRKISGLPYFTHPEAVAMRVKELGGSEDSIAAAYLHDVVEDTNATLDEIAKNFTPHIASLVAELTSDKEECKRIGKAIYLTKKIDAMSEEARLVKLADREHNVSDLAKGKNEFARRYSQETHHILGHVSFVNNATEEELEGSILDKIRPFLI